MPKPPDHDRSGDRDIAGYLSTEAATPEDDGEARPAATDDSEVMRDMEKSLVERIADVDDDRRRTAQQLQKALNTHRDATAARIQRGLWVGTALAILLAAGMAAALGGMLWWGTKQRAELTADLAALDRRIDTLERPASAPRGAFPAAPSEAATAEPEAAVAALAERINVLTARVERLSTAIESAPVPSPVAGLTAAQTSDLLAHRDRVDRELAALKTALDQALNEASNQRTEAVAAIARETARTTAKETAEATAKAAIAEAAPPWAAEPDANPAAMAPARLDAVVDAQLARLEREYQRLARRIDSPALRSEGSTDRAAGETPATAPPPTAPAAVASAPVPSGSTLTVGERRYAVQLLGVRDRAALTDFIRSKPLPEQVYTRQERLRGQPWYVLIHSLHPTLAAATAAQQRLPPALAGLDVWIRALPADAEVDVVATSPGAR
jgi:DamX protein